MKNLFIFLLSLTFFVNLFCYEYISDDSINTNLPEPALEQVVLEQLAEILLNLSQVTAKPKDPDTAENFLKSIVSGAFAIGRQIAKEEKPKEQSQHYRNITKVLQKDDPWKDFSLPVQEFLTSKFLDEINT